MGQFFSDVVEQAVADIYYCYDSARAKAAETALALAAEQGDGDACYFLSRCFSGREYHWEYHPFEENDRRAFELLCRGVRLGSDVAVLGALRRNMLTPALREELPFSSLEEAWRSVYRKAANGCTFCQMMVANAYYYLDVIEIEDQRESAFPSRAAWEDWKGDQVWKSFQWYQKAFEGGMGIAGRNLLICYLEGRGNLIAPNREQFPLILQQGAELGYPDWMYDWAFELYFHLDRRQEGLVWAQKAAELGHLKGWGIVGHAYRYGKTVERDPARAVACFEKSAPYGRDSVSCGQLGEMYFLGQGAKQDYATAVQYLERCYAIIPDNTNLGMLGVCCLLGWGCAQNPVRGRTLLTLPNCPDSRYKSYGLGRMYAEGIGVPEDIEKGVRYLQAAGDYEPAKEALKQYKKSLFGVWRRR